MKLSPIVLKLRAAETRFGNRIAGCAQIEDVMRGTISADTAFVVQLGEEASQNNDNNSINQIIDERFAVIVALANDTSDADKTGLTAYDLVHTVRSEIFSAILGWFMTDAEDLISYVGGRILDFNRAYLWYQFEFTVPFRIDQDDCTDPGSVDVFNTIYAQWELSPSANLPYEGGLPVTLFDPDFETQVDLTINPDDGAFDRSFAEAFDLYTGY